MLEQSPNEGAASVPPARPEEVAADVEAALLGSDRALTLAKIAHAIGLDDDPSAASVVRGAISALNEHYAATGRSFRIEQVAGGFRATMLAQHAKVLTALHGAKESQTLSRAAVETLAIIAYRQPIARADLESIRGVSCGEVLRSLLDKRLVDIVGRSEELGRPMLYGTTKRFLEVFGLASIKDLPNHQDFAPTMSESAASAVVKHINPATTPAGTETV